MKQNISRLALSAIALLAVSCNDSFMDRQPQTEIGVSSYFNTEEDLKMYCYNLYDFPNFNNYTADAGTDNQATTDVVEVKNIMLSANPTSMTVNAGWDWSRLRTINLFLENCERASVSDDVLAHYQGIARFFRARFYMDKVKAYSDVPWYDKSLTTSDEDLYKARDSRDFVVQKIFEDYTFAAEHVKTQQESGAVDKWTVLTYMARMIQEARSKGLSLRREAFQESGRRVTLYKGVREWFARINAYGAARGIRILHYINSSGLKEIIEGTEIAHEFRRIYACSFLYDIDGVAYWPAVAVNYTNKTQFIFKINKGVESVFDSKMVNRYIPENERPVPFKHMIYVGDGTTDIPCMRLVKNSGGHSIAVYNPEIRNARRELNGLIRDNRVSHVCPADYSEGSDMDILVKTIIDKIDLDDRLEKLEVVK